MNYRHIYHAGNFADVVKHLALISVLENLCKKEAPYYFLDAFAGIGLYSLNSDQASKTGEADLGINLINKYSGNLPPLLSKYKELVAQYNGLDNSIYPGSPLIIANYLREKDKADFCELHKEDYQTLSYNMCHYKGCNIANLDAYTALKAFLPPKQKRGAILIDPPFELTNEFDKIISGFEIINKKFSHGTTIIWYPIKNYKQIKYFYQNLLPFQKEIMKIEFSLPAVQTGLSQIGILIINPPNIMNILKENLEFLKKHIYSGKASFNISLLA